MDGGAIIARLGGVSLVALRTASSGVDAHGRATKPPAPQPIPFVGAVQPLSQRDLAILDSGLRTSEMKKVYTATPLQTANEATGQLADTFVYKGDTWQVQQVGDWEGMGNYYRVFVKKIPPG